jgi:hypothetical protein
MEGRKSFLLRIDPELWRELERWAQDELRSVNGQIEFLLKQSVSKRKRGRSRADGGGKGRRRMRVILQRVSRATVRVDGKAMGEIGRGIVLLLGVHQEDTAECAEFLAAKCAELRIFPDDHGKMNLFGERDRRSGAGGVAIHSLWGVSEGAAA